MYPIASGSAGQVGNTWMSIKVAYCTNCRHAQYPNIRKWLIFLEGHYAKTWNGYSLPVRALGNWVIEPSVAVIDARMGTYSDQAIGNFRPTGSGTDGQISVTISYPPGMTYTTNILPQVTCSGSYTEAYSSYYGGYVASASLWRWGLTSYDGSGSIGYHMGGYAETWALVPLYFAMRVKANSYLYVSGVGIVDRATSGQLNFLFAAYTDRLEYQSGYQG